MATAVHTSMLVLIMILEVLQVAKLVQDNFKQHLVLFQRVKLSSVDVVVQVMSQRAQLMHQVIKGIEVGHATYHSMKRAKIKFLGILFIRPFNREVCFC